MSDLKEFFNHFDRENLAAYPYERLLMYYRKIQEKRSAIERTAKDLKLREDKIKDTIMMKMHEEKIKSVKTDQGLVAITTAESVITKDVDMFLAWLRKNPDQLSILSRKPYLQEKVKTLAEDGGELPPGLDWYKELKLSIRKA